MQTPLPPLNEITIVLQQAPRDLQVIISVPIGLVKMEQSSGILSVENPPIAILQQSWRPKPVNPPQRQLLEGPLRDYEVMCKLYDCLNSEERCLAPLDRGDKHSIPG